MGKRNYRLKESRIPDGYQIYFERLPVSGINFRKSNTVSFIKSNSLQIELEREPSNNHDSNAIKVIGIVKRLFGQKRLHLGYVPKEVAQKLVSSGFDLLVLPRLHKTFLGSDNYTEIDIQILGPAGKKYEFNPPVESNADNFSDYVPRIKQLKSENKFAEAERLLIECVEWTEDESSKDGAGVAPWYYNQLAIIYRKQKKPLAELAILERYDNQIKAPGRMPAQLKLRLEKARHKLNK